MSNFYNEDIKNRFINENNFTDIRKKTLRGIFKKTKIHEEALNLDIFEMNKSETESLLYYFKSRSIQHIRTYISHLRRYVSWCDQEGLVPHHINYFDFQVNKDEAEKYINRHISENQIININEMDEYLVKLQSKGDYQGALIINLLFLGLKLSPNDDECEIRNIKLSDVDFNNNTIKTIKRDIVFNDKLKDLIKSATEQTERVRLVYDEKELNSHSSRNDYNNLDYLVRSRTRGYNLYHKTKYQYLRNKIEEISIFTNNPSINATYLNLSGIIHYIKSNYTEDDYNRPKGSSNVYGMYEDVIKKFNLKTEASTLRGRLLQFLK